VLATHQEIETASEPWILLPLIYSRKMHGIYTEYSHLQAKKGIDDFCTGMPHGVADYSAELREFVLRLYSRRAASSARYFLDKTPRYHLICEEIGQLFPEARFIFLWRNPLAVIASMIETWGRGHWNLYYFEADLFDGLENLVAACKSYGRMACSVKYEDLVGSREPWERLFEYLDLEFDESQLGAFTGVSLAGRLGDPTGQKNYTSFSTEPLDKWKHVLSTPTRKYWCRKYLHQLGAERLAFMGYDMDTLLEELRSVPLSYRLIPSDLLCMLFGMAFRLFEPLIARDKWFRFRKRKRIYSHS